MKITELAVEQQKTLTEATQPTERFVFGIDRHDPLHQKVAQEIDNLRETDPRLYHKVTSLN